MSAIGCEQISRPSSARLRQKQLLVIHTDRSGEVSKKDLDAARKVARDVDEGESPVNAIVSVLMLREGWDVQSVTVIVGLRPYTSQGEHPPRADHRPRPAPDVRATCRPPTSSGSMSSATTPSCEFVEQLEREEDITLDSFNLKEQLVITTIAPDPEKLEHGHRDPRAQPDPGTEEVARRGNRGA